MALPILQSITLDYQRLTYYNAERTEGLCNFGWTSMEDGNAVEGNELMLLFNLYLDTIVELRCGVFLCDVVT